MSDPSDAQRLDIARRAYALRHRVTDAAAASQGYIPPRDPLLVDRPAPSQARPFVGLRACFMLDRDVDEEE